MGKYSSITDKSDYQLISIGIELAHKVMSLVDCKIELASDPHFVKANQLAREWNEVFIKRFVER